MSVLVVSYAAELNGTTSYGNGDILREVLSVKIEPTAYFGAYGQYHFSKNYRVKPFLLGGFSFVSIDETAASKKQFNSSDSTNSRELSSSAFVLSLGYGLEIAIINDVSFIIDYRLHQDVAEQSTSEFNGSLSNQF